MGVNLTEGGEWYNYKKVGKERKKYGMKRRIIY